MPFHIKKHDAWVKAKLELENTEINDVSAEYSLEPVDLELNAIANRGSSEFRDEYIERSERTVQNGVRPITSSLVAEFFKDKITSTDHVIFALNGIDVLEELLVFDDSNSHFDLSSATPNRKLLATRNDMILKKIITSSGARYIDITSDVLESANKVLRFILPQSNWNLREVFARLVRQETPQWDSDQQKKWEESDFTNHLNMDLLLQLYRWSRLADYARDENLDADEVFQSSFSHELLRRIGDFSSGASLESVDDPESVIRNLNKHEGDFESIFVEQSLRSLVDQKYSSISTSGLSHSDLSLSIIDANHLFDMTDGSRGLSFFTSLSKQQWEEILNDSDLTQSIFTTLSNTVYVQSLTFFRDLLGEDKNIRYRLIEMVLLNDRLPEEFKILMSCALAAGMRIQLRDFDMTLAEFMMLSGDVVSPAVQESVRNYCMINDCEPETSTLGDLLLYYISKIHLLQSDGLYLYPSLVETAQMTFGLLSNRARLPKAFRAGAFDWCLRFDRQFKTFTDYQDSLLQQETQKTFNRRLIVENQKLMVALDHKRAQQELFDSILEPLDSSFDPRVEKSLAHNSYYRKVGASQHLATASGQNRLAFRRRLDQENNEWGRDFEKKVREDAVFRLDVLQEAKASLEKHSETSVQQIVSLYDPEGVLQRNLALIHLLRYIHLESLVGDPFLNVENLNIPVILKTNFNIGHYAKAHEFDHWLKSIQKNQPELIESLTQRLLDLDESQRKLSFEVFFLEVNEVETFQYLIDPELGPLALFDFVGRIRSWTSGYQGRLLTRMQVYFDQDAIRQSRMNSDVSDDLDAEDFVQNYQESIGLERFGSANEGVMKFLTAAENGSDDPLLSISDDEVYQILKYFSETGFSSYLPQWIFFIINHRFLDAEGRENFMPMIRAFDVLATSDFPKHLMRDYFEQNGYLQSPELVTDSNAIRQAMLFEQAKRCLGKLPSGRARNENYKTNNFPIRRRILWASKRTKNLSPDRLNQLLMRFDDTTVAMPGEYFNYRHQAKRLLKTHSQEAVRALVDEALQQPKLEFERNKPLKPWFKGLIGDVVTDNLLQTSIEQIATDSSSTRSSFVSSLINFSGLLVNWADRNHIDLNEAFGEAFERYQVPEGIRLLHEEILELQSQIDRVEGEILVESAKLKTAMENTLRATSDLERSMSEFELNQKSEQIRSLQDRLQGSSHEESLLRRLERLQMDRNQRIASLNSTMSSYDEQALMQIVTYVYGCVRRQYLKEVLISDGDVTGEIIEKYLETELIPQFQTLSASIATSSSEELRDLEQRIHFLESILSQIEGSEYLNDVNVAHSRNDRYKRLSR